MTFTNRTEAGRRLAARLRWLRSGNMVVLGVPPGGVPVAAEVAEAFGAPLDVVVVSKLTVPLDAEPTFGALAEDGVRVVEGDLAAAVDVRADDLAQAEDAARAELARHVRSYREFRSPIALTNRTAVVVDDGVVTGATARAACQVARKRGATFVVFAAPVASFDTSRMLESYADRVACLTVPDHLQAVGYFYADFTSVGDADVVSLLRSAADRVSGPAGPSPARRCAGQ